MKCFRSWAGHEGWTMKQAAGSTRQAARFGISNARLIWACCFLLPAACCLIGCMTFGPTRNPGGNPAKPELHTALPDAQALVGFLNGNAARISSIESDSVAMEIKAGTAQ